MYQALIGPLFLYFDSTSVKGYITLSIVTVAYLPSNALIQCCCDAGPPSATLQPHWIKVLCLL